MVAWLNHDKNKALNMLSQLKKIEHVRKRMFD